MKGTDKMQDLRDWAFSICSALVVCGIVLQIVPKSNLEGIFKLVVSVFFLCVMLSPIIIRIPQESIILEEYYPAVVEQKAEDLRRVVESQAQNAAQREAEKIVADKLRQMGINYHSITININTGGQSGADYSADIILDESMRPQHEKTATLLISALQMDVRLGYEKE